MLLTKEKVSKLLGRSLTSSEVDSFETYIKIATQRLELLLCMKLCGESGERTYQSWNGYRTLYVDVFRDITSVTVAGAARTDFIKRQNELFNGNWYNIIEFDERLCGERVVVNATWGFEGLPVDLEQLLANMFDQCSIDRRTDNRVKSKKIEDFSVTYKDEASFESFVSANELTISKYCQCGMGQVQ